MPGAIAFTMPDDEPMVATAVLPLLQRKVPAEVASFSVETGNPFRHNAVVPVIAETVGIAFTDTSWVAAALPQPFVKV